MFLIVFADFFFTNLPKKLISIKKWCQRLQYRVQESGSPPTSFQHKFIEPRSAPNLTKKYIIYRVVQKKFMMWSRGKVWEILKYLWSLSLCIFTSFKKLELSKLRKKNYWALKILKMACSKKVSLLNKKKYIFFYFYIKAK